MITLGVLARNERVLYENSIYWVGYSYFVTFSLVPALVLLSRIGLLSKRCSNFVVMWTRYGITWLIIGALAFVASVEALPPGNWLIKIIMAEDFLSTLLVQFALGLFYGALFALSIPFISQLGIAAGLLMFKYVIKRYPSATRVVQTPEVTQGDKRTFIRFLTRSIFVAFTTMPILASHLNIPIMVNSSGVQALSPEFQAAMYLVSLLVGVGHFLEQKGFRIVGETVSNKPLSESYFKWLMAGFSITGVISIIPFLRDIGKFATSATSGFLLVATIVASYSIILGSAIAIIAINRRFSSLFLNLVPLIGALLLMTPVADQLNALTGLSFFASLSRISEALIWSLPIDEHYLRYILPSFAAAILVPLIFLSLVPIRIDRALITRTIIGVSMSGTLAWFAWTSGEFRVTSEYRFLILLLAIIILVYGLRGTEQRPRSLHMPNLPAVQGL